MGTTQKIAQDLYSTDVVSFHIFCKKGGVYFCWGTLLERYPNHNTQILWGAFLDYVNIAPEFNSRRQRGMK